MLAQPAHLLAFDLVHRRVVANQVTGHEGSFRPTRTFRTLLSLPSMFGLDQWHHFASKLALPFASYRRR
jgi:hypothetical protein